MFFQIALIIGKGLGAHLADFVKVIPLPCAGFEEVFLWRLGRTWLASRQDNDTFINGMLQIYIEENAAYNVWIEARNSNNVKIGDGALYVFSVGPLSSVTITEPATAEVAKPSGDYLHVEWDDVANATYYQITMRDLSTGDLLQGKDYYKVESSAADFACSVLSEGHEYRVWIAAYDDQNGRIAESGMTFVYVPDVAIQVDLTSKITELKNKLPAGSYWAHTPDTTYNEFTTNTSGCSCEYKHGESRRGIGGHESSNGPGTDGSCGCNSYRGAIQCNGYARVICDYLFGSNWANESSKGRMSVQILR